MMRQYELYGMLAVPLTYIIDPEGNIVKGWYGYLEGRARKELKELGLI